MSGVIALAFAFLAGVVFMFLLGRLASLWVQRRLKRDPAYMEKVMEAVRHKLQEEEEL